VEPIGNSSATSASDDNAILGAGTAVDGIFAKSLGGLGGAGLSNASNSTGGTGGDATADTILSHFQMGMGGSGGGVWAGGDVTVTLDNGSINRRAGLGRQRSRPSECARAARDATASCACRRMCDVA